MWQMQVRLPECATWYFLDVPRGPLPSFAEAAADTAYSVSVRSICQQLAIIFSLFRDKEIVLFKCQGEMVRGDRLRDEDRVYDLTWLIGFRTDIHDIMLQAAHEITPVDPRVKWSCEPPCNTEDNIIRCVVFLEPLGKWGAATIGNFKDIIRSGFEEIMHWKFSITMQKSQVCIKLCQGSHAIGDNLHDAHLAIDDKWYWVSFNNYLMEIEKIAEWLEDE
ncbi:unnamed protein product [Prorocentrum cordatum]|uniref:Autophagy protein 5 n=1 Tax=Prorocentrum cordatum TaxID=2364126 RepID=A0ABN9QUD1_9DINO|nr:unnamed protein product [Polarella glacialis]